MKSSMWLAFVILIVTPPFAFSQETKPVDSLLSAAREIMTSANTCALITIDDKGYPMARTMDAFHPEADFTVWFGTNPSSSKVIQIQNNPKVALYYLTDDESGYVTLHGTARIVNTASEKDKWWKDEWKAFYRNRTEDYTLIKVSPEWMEVVSYAHGIISTASTWEAPRVLFDTE